MKIKTACDEALAAFEVGFIPIPLVGNSRVPGVKWDPWIRNISARIIRRYYQKHPDAELAIFTGDGLMVLDADTQEGVVALHQLLQSFDIEPPLIVKTKRGEHVYLRRAAGTHAKSDAPDKEKHPSGIDIKTGRALAIYPPSTGKSFARFEIDSIDDLPEVDQSFIDAVYRHNGRDAPRPPSQQQPSTAVAPLSSSELELKRTRISEFLAYINPDIGYNDWVRVALAIYGEMEGTPAGFQLFDEWSAPGTKYPGTVALRTKWASFDRYSGRRVTIATIAKLAQEGGANLSALAHAHSVREVLASDDLDTAVETVIETSHGDAAPPASTEGTKEEHPLARFSLRGKSQVMLDELADQIVLPGRVLVIGQLSVWYGRPNTGKTLLLLWVCIEAIRADLIKDYQLYYVNADDTYPGLAQKTEIAEEFGFDILAPGHEDFKAGELLSLLHAIVKAGEAPKTIVLLDTLKKFTDIMGKQGATAFGRIAREFVAAGGTLVGLGHTNKNRDDDGKLVYSGVADYVDDSDCAYVLDILDEANDQRIVSFENLKSRGNIAKRAAFSYSIEDGLTYRQILDSVSIVDQDELTDIEEATAKRAAHPEDLLSKIAELIQRGYNAKGQLVQKAAESTEYGQHRVRAAIDAYTGTDPTKHRWSCEKGAHGLQTFTLLQNESPPDADTLSDPNSVIDDGPLAMTGDPVDDTEAPSEDLDVPY